VVALRFLKTGGWRGNWPYLPKLARDSLWSRNITPTPCGDVFAMHGHEHTPFGEQGERRKLDRWTRVPQTGDRIMAAILTGLPCDPLTICSEDHREAHGLIVPSQHGPRRSWRSLTRKRPGGTSSRREPSFSKPSRNSTQVGEKRFTFSWIYNLALTANGRSQPRHGTLRKARRAGAVLWAALCPRARPNFEF